ncbi:MAG TPA: ankyrin repeat domain-containing protein, partial [Planctomycetota bacterium]|nr:ankyrin repeat domain-containing protein [Planctomycetota bacterium]
MSDPQDLLAAIERGDPAAARAALAADPGLARARDAQGVSLLLQARYRGRHDLVELIRGARRGPDELDLFEAAALGRADLVAAHVAAHPRGVGDVTADGFTALHLAAFFGHAETVRLLVERGADVEAVARNPMQVRPLHSAVAGRDRASVNALLARGASPNVRQRGGFTPLHAAAQSGDAVMVRALLAVGA